MSATEQFDDMTGQSRLVINEYLPSGMKPTIITANKNGEIISRSPIRAKNSDFRQNGATVGLANILSVEHQKRLQNRKILPVVFHVLVSFLRHVALKMQQ